MTDITNIGDLVGAAEYGAEHKADHIISNYWNDRNYGDDSKPRLQISWNNWSTLTVIC